MTREFSLKKNLFAILILLVSTSALAQPVFPYRSMTLYVGGHGILMNDTLLKESRAIIGRYIRYGKVDAYLETRSVHAFEGERTLCMSPTRPEYYYELKQALEGLLMRSTIEPLFEVQGQTVNCVEIASMVGPA